MNARAVNAAAGVIAAAMEQGRQTPAGLALALDSAGLLNSPEHAAEFGLMRSLLADSGSTDEDPIAYTLTDKAADEEDVTPQVRRLRALLAGQRESVSAAVEVSKDESGTTLTITPARTSEAGGAS